MGQESLSFPQSSITDDYAPLTPRLATWVIKKTPASAGVILDV